MEETKNCPQKNEQNTQKSNKNILAEVEFVKVSRLDQQEQKMEQIVEGPFQIIQIIEENQAFFYMQVENFKYSIYKELPVYVTQYEDYRSFIFPIIEGFYVILIEDKYASNYDILDAIFNQIGTLIYQDKEGKAIQQEIQQDQKTPQNDQQQQKNKYNDQDSSQQLCQPQEKVKLDKKQLEQKEKERQKQEIEQYNSVGQFIYKTGKFVESGINMGAGILQKGIEHTGNFIENKIKDTKEVEIKQGTFQKAEIIKNQSGKVMKISSQTAGTILGMNVKMAEMAGKQISKRVQKEESKHDFSKNNNYDYIKEVGRQTLDSTLEIIKALEEAASFVGQQLGQSSRKVIKKKYGEQAALLADIGIQSAENVGKTYKEVRGLGYKKLAKAAAKETAKSTAKNLGGDKKIKEEKVKNEQEQLDEDEDIDKNKISQQKQLPLNEKKQQ